jgi:hypothetical protein
MYLPDVTGTLTQCYGIVIAMQEPTVGLWIAGRFTLTVREYGWLSTLRVVFCEVAMFGCSFASLVSGKPTGRFAHDPVWLADMSTIESVFGIRRTMSFGQNNDAVESEHMHSPSEAGEKKKGRR